ncbi:MAG: efflux RND transporter periplasmic adaptor subunit [Arenimonas sp.]
MSRPDELLNQLRIDRSAPSPAPTRWGRWLAVAIGVAVLGLSSWMLFGRARPIEVQTEQATTVETGAGSSASVLDASGYITARRIATVSSKITGKVAEVLIEEGQRVEEGQILARLDPVDMVAQQDLARSQLGAAQSQLAEAQAQLHLAGRNLARQRELATKKLVAASALDAAIAERDASAARLQSLQRNVGVARDALAIAANGVDSTVIRAPFSGVIVTKAAQPGEMISPVSAGGGSIRTGIGTLVDLDSLEVEVDVNEAYIGRVQPKMPVEAVLNAYPDWKIPAEVIAIIPTADRAKATVKVRIALNSRDPRIVPDMGVRVSFLEPHKAADANAPVAPRVSIPATAVRQDGTQDIVFVLVDERVERRAVRLGNQQGDHQLVLAGVSAGEAVIVQPPAGLRDGDKVRVAPAPSP